MTADPSSKPRPKRWKTALIVLGSAAFGGVAFALWNRRELAQMHTHPNGPGGGQVSADQSDPDQWDPDQSDPDQWGEEMI